MIDRLCRWAGQSADVTTTQRLPKTKRRLFMRRTLQHIQPHGSAETADRIDAHYGCVTEVTPLACARSGDRAVCPIREIFSRRMRFKEARMVLRRLLSSSVFLAFSSSLHVARAQDASVIGTVTDETKSVLPGATVTATNLETGRQTSGVTDERGSCPAAADAAGKVQGPGGAAGVLERRRSAG